MTAETKVACVRYGKEYNINPRFIMAIILTESMGDRFATNGDCKGLMQVSERWHKDRMDSLGVTDLFSTDGNIQVGVDYLAELFERYEEICYVLDRYNGNSKALENWVNCKVSVYARKVLNRCEALDEAYYERLEKGKAREYLPY